MGRLIDADEVKEALTGWEVEPTDLDIKYTIDRIPTADAVPVVHGRWILHPNSDGTCDQCGRYQKAIWDFDNQQNFCGHCGADMRERESNETV